MATSATDQVDQLKTLIDDLEERRQNLRLFDGTEEINSHCDDLIGQVTLTVESAMDHLNKVQDRMVNEINEYRRQLLDTVHDQDQSELKRDLRNLSNEIEIVKSTKLPHGEALELAKSLLERANDLRKQLRAETFGSEFMRFFEAGFLESDVIGRLETTQKDVQDDFAIRHLALDETASSAQALDFYAPDMGVLGPFEVTAIQFLRDNKLAVAFENYSLMVWDFKANQMSFEFETCSSSCEPYTALAQLPCGHLVVGKSSGTIEIWDLEAQERICFFGYTGQAVQWLKALPNGKLIDFARVIRVWDLSKLNEAEIRKPEFSFEPHANFYFSYTEINDWNSQRPETTCYLSKRIHFYRDDFSDYEQGLDLILRAYVEMLHDGNLAYSYLLPDGPTVTVWDPNTGETIKEVAFDAEDVESCVVLPNGEVVLCHSDNTVEIYSLDDQQLLQSFKNDQGPIVAIRMQSRHSLVFVHLKNPKLPVFAPQNRTRRLDHDHLATLSSFSDDGKLFSVGSVYQRIVTWPVQN